MATVASAARVCRSPYDSASPAATRLTYDTRALSDSAGRRPAASGSTAAPGEMPYTAMPARTKLRRAAGWASAPAELAACTTSGAVGIAASTASNRAS